MGYPEALDYYVIVMSRPTRLIEIQIVRFVSHSPLKLTTSRWFVP